MVGPGVELEVFASQPPTATTPDTDLFRLLGETLRRHDPEARSVPCIIPGGTDAQSWSRLGTRCYGCAPTRLEAGTGIAFARLYHGDDEWIPEAGFRWGLRVLWDVVRAHCTA